MDYNEYWRVHDQVTDKLAKFDGLCRSRCFKLIYQWVIDKHITLPQFQVLCDEAARRSDP